MREVLVIKCPEEVILENKFHIIEMSEMFPNVENTKDRTLKTGPNLEGIRQFIH